MPGWRLKKLTHLSARKYLRYSDLVWMSYRLLQLKKDAPPSRTRCILRRLLLLHSQCDIMHNDCYAGLIRTVRNYYFKLTSVWCFLNVDRFVFGLYPTYCWCRFSPGLKSSQYKDRFRSAVTRYSGLPKCSSQYTTVRSIELASTFTSTAKEQIVIVKRTHNYPQTEPS